MSAKVDIGVWLQPTDGVRRVVDQAVLADRAGLSFVGITDGQMIWSEAYVCLTAAAVATSAVRLGPWVTNPITRHPTVTASAICSLDDVSDGRAFLGIGNGDDSVLTIDKQRRKLDGLAADVELIEALSRGDTVQGPVGQWTLAAARATSPPVYWAANGPRSLHYGGRYAAGVIYSGWTAPDLMEEALRVIAEGARAGGRDGSDVVPIFNTALVIDDDSERARATAKSYVARGLIYPSSATVPGWSEEARQKLLAAYDYYSHLSAEQGAARLVPDELVTSKSVAGTPLEVARQLQAISDAGYAQIALLPMGDVEATIERLASEVMPHLRRNGHPSQPEPIQGGAT